MGAEFWLDLPSDRSAPARAREAVVEALRAWRLLDLLDGAQLVVSELVTNAVEHGMPPVSLRLRRLGDQFRMDVTDSASDVGRAGGGWDQPDAAGRESGRGLAIVRAVASHTGAEVVPGRGKQVFASWNLPHENAPGGGPLR